MIELLPGLRSIGKGVSPSALSTDTRSLEKDQAYLALKGERFDGHQFIEQALKKGASAIICHDLGTEIDRFSRAFPQTHFCIVENSLKYLQDLAHHHRKRMNAKVVAISGSNGKTTTKELLATALRATCDDLVVATRANDNNHIGVPQTLLRLRPEHKFAVVELGSNHPGEMEVVARITAPDVALVTNIGDTHLEFFHTREAVLEEESAPLQFSRVGIVNGRDPLLKELDATKVGLIDLDYKATPVKLRWNGGPVIENPHLFGSYNYQNMALALACIVELFGCVPAEVVAALEGYQPEQMRSQWMRFENSHVFMDAYNANPTSMLALLGELDELRGLKGVSESETLLILGEMGELGDQAQQGHDDVMRATEDSKRILIGNAWGKQAFASKLDPAEIEKIREEMRSHKLIILKGSRSNRLEQLLN